MSKKTPLHAHSHVAHYVPKAGLTPKQEIARILDFMKKHRSAYDKDQKLQQRLRELLDAQTQQQELGRLNQAGVVARNLGMA